MSSELTDDARAAANRLRVAALTDERIEQMRKDLRILPGFTASQANLALALDALISARAEVAQLRAERDEAVLERDKERKRGDEYLEVARRLTTDRTAAIFERDAALRKAEEARAAAIEECAMACEAEEARRSTGFEKVAAYWCARRVRALASNTPFVKGPAKDPGLATVEPEETVTHVASQREATSSGGSGAAESAKGPPAANGGSTSTDLRALIEEIARCDVHDVDEVTTIYVPNDLWGRIQAAAARGRAE